MNVHVMIDIETLGTGNNACLLSLAGVKFDPNDQTHNMLDAFYVGIDLDSCIQLGMTVTGKTIEWWFHPDRAAARAAFLEVEHVDLASTLDGFAQWYGNKSLPTWGNGATFDNVILRNAYNLIGRECPWHYRDDRCFRTFRNLAPFLGYVGGSGIEHHALDDARAQTFLLKDIAAFLRLEL